MKNTNQIKPIHDPNSSTPSSAQSNPSPPGEGTGMVAVRKDFAAFAPSRETFGND
jgi:hypothetical protein